jgi:hypothetical protein
MVNKTDEVQTFSQDQVIKVKELLTNFVKNELIDDNKFDVKQIELMLGNFPGDNMKEALALSTKSAYDTTIGYLARSTKSESTGNNNQNAQNKKYNEEIREHVEVFFNIMKNDSYVRDGNVQKGQYGVARDGLNALEAVLLMTFGGVGGIAPSITTEGHTATGNEVRAVAKTWDAVDNTSTLVPTASGDALPMESHEGRAVYLTALWTLYDQGPKLFGSGRNTITVVQAVNDGVTNACCQQYCSTVSLQNEEVARTYDLWANSGDGKNHFTSTLGAILATDNVANGITTGKILGGEDAFSTTILNRTLGGAAEKFTQDQIGAVLRVGSTVSQTMTIEQLNIAWGMGHRTLGFLGITINNAHAASPAELTDAKVLSNNDNAATSKFMINQSDILTPAIYNILKSDFRDLFLKEVLASDGDIHPKALSTAIEVAQMREGNKAFAIGTVSNKKGSSIAQAMPGALALINEVREFYGKAKFDDYWTPEKNKLSYLSDHDNDDRAMNTTMLRFLANTSRTPVGTDEEKSETLFEREVYTKYDDKYVDTNGELTLTPSHIVGVNKHYSTNNRDTTQAIVAKIVLRQFKLSPSTFIEKALPTLLRHINRSSSGLDDGIYGTVRANYREAFGNVSGSDTRWGPLFSGNSIQDLTGNDTKYNHESALVYFFMLSLLTPAELSKALTNSDTRLTNGTQLAHLLKYTKATDSTESKLELKHKDADYKIRDGSYATSWAETDLTQGDLWNESGNLTNRILAGKGYTHTTDGAQTDHANIKCAKKALVDQIIAVRFFGLNTQATETCRLQLINGYQISAKKIQDLAESGSSVINDYTAGSAIDLTDASGLATIVDVTYKTEIKSPVFVKAAFMSLAKAESYYNVGNAVDPVAAKTLRDSDFISAVNNALVGSDVLQQKEFFITIAKLATQTAVGNEEKTYQNLAISVITMIAAELHDELGSDAFHVSKGWKTNAPNFTADQNCSVLAAAVSKALTMGVIANSTALNIEAMTAEERKANPDYKQQRNALDCSLKIMQLAQICAQMDGFDKGCQLGLYAIRKKVTVADVSVGGDSEANTATDLKGKKNILMGYTAGFLYEPENSEYGLYDSDDSGAGFSQNTIDMLIVEGGFTDTTFRNVYHAIGTKVDGTSATQVLNTHGSHLFIGLIDGAVQVPDGYDVNGNAAYKLGYTNHKQPKD